MPISRRMGEAGTIAGYANWYGGVMEWDDTALLAFTVVVGAGLLAIGQSMIMLLQ